MVMKKKTAPQKSQKKASTKSTPTKIKTKAKPKEKKVHNLVRAYRDLLMARAIDHQTINLYKQNKCHFQIGGEGHEAVQVAAAHVFRPGLDWFFPYYRDIALVSALGVPPESFMLNAMNKQDDPFSHGRQMPMHFCHTEKRIISQSSPTGTQYLQAVGCAVGVKLKGAKEVVYVSSGEGTCSQGAFHEAINWAARDGLPVVFLIQNNGYAISVPVHEQLAGESVYKITAGFSGLAREQVDGTDYLACLKAITKAHERAKRGQGPTLIEAMVPRLQSHSISDNQLKYRSQAELDADIKRDPKVKLRKLVKSKKLMTEKALRDLELSIKLQVTAASDWAEQQADPDPATAGEHTFADDLMRDVPEPSTENGTELHMVDALNQALAEELAISTDVCIFGQDVAHGKGGVFGVTTGLTKQFGKKRVFNSQLAEASIVGSAIGLALRGLKPVAEIQFGDYVWTGMMQLRTELPMFYYRTAGDNACPAVIRVPVGGYIHGGPYHSQNIEATFAHFPGMYVIYPSNAADAKGLLKSSIHSTNPVLFLEHKGLYRQVYSKALVGGRDYYTPIGKAKIIRPGSDLTIVTWGALVYKSLAAANALEHEGYSVEVIDIRSIVPLDIQSIYDSVRKTNRVLIAHEDLEFMGFGAEIAAQIASDCFEQLDAPVKRLGMKYAAAIPHSPVLEDALLPQNETLLQAAHELLTY